MRPSTAALLAIAAIPFASAAPNANLAARNDQCGVKGYDKGKPQAYSYSTSAADKTVAGCAAKCAKSSKCQSYAVGSGACLLYTSAV